MTYDQFIANHPELSDCDEATKAHAYDMYLDVYEASLSELS